MAESKRSIRWVEHLISGNGECFGMLDIFLVPQGFNPSTKYDELTHIASVEIEDFHSISHVFDELNNIFSIKISYFYDETIKTDAILALRKLINSSDLSDAKKKKWNKIVDAALNSNEWLFFVSD